MDLARKILLTIEEAPYKGKYGFTLTLTGYSVKEVNYNIGQLHDAGLVQAEETVYHNGRTEWQIERLTWQGHEFLDAARDQNRWNQAKRTISEKGGALTFDILGSVLTQLMRQAVGL